MHVVIHNRITVQAALKNPKAKGSIKLARKLAMGLAFAHLKYLIHRPGEDRPEGGRRVFNELEDDVDPKQIRQALMKMRNKSTINHKLMLSPEVSPSDVHAYTREVMHRLGQEKGQDLIWWAVPHKNTDQHHPHLIVLPVDRRGKRVTLSTQDYDLLKRFGDEYIQRAHPKEYLAAKQARADKRERLVQERRANDEAARNERIDQGLELPWYHRKIVREQLEPFEHWKHQQWLNDFAADTTSGDDSPTGQQRSKRLEKIEVDGKVWTNEHTLAELKQVDKFLWRNHDKWIEVDEYKKLVRWIAVKEEEANRAPQAPEEQVQQTAELSKQDTTPGAATTKSRSPVKKLPFQTIQVDGKEFNSQQSLDELKQLDAFLWQNHDKRIDKSEYKKLVRWIGVKEDEAALLSQPSKDADQQAVAPPRAEDSTKQTVSQKAQTPAKKLPFQTIEVDGKEFNSRQSLDELKELDAFLWQNRDKRIDKSEYKKLVRWIGVKEDEAAQLGEPSKDADQQAVTPPRAEDSTKQTISQKAQTPAKKLPFQTIEVDGKEFNSQQSLDELKELDAFLWQNRDKRIDKSEYKKLVRWIGVKEDEAAQLGEPSKDADQQAVTPPRAEDSTKQTVSQKAQTPGKKLPFQTIEVDGKEFNSQQSLDELKELDALLWQNRDKWIDKSEYKKLVRWIGVKEDEAAQVAEPSKDTDQQKVSPPRAEDSIKQTVSQKAQTPAKKLPFQTIEVDGKEFNSQQSLDELKDLDAFLWQNRNKWIDKSEYKKLVRWIAVKEEQLEQTANQTPEQIKTTKKLDQPEKAERGKSATSSVPAPGPSDSAAPRAPEASSTADPEPPQPERKDATAGDDRAGPQPSVKSPPVKRFNEQGQVQIDGKTFNRESSYEVISATVKDLNEHKDKRARLAEGQYKQLKQLLEYKDRERFSGVIQRELESAKRQYRQRRTDELAKINTRRYVNPLQQRVMSHPGMGLFMTAASISSELVRSIPLKDTSDPLKKSKDELHDARNDVLSQRRQRSNADQRERDDGTIERIDKGIDLVEQAEEERRKQRKRQRPRRTNEDYYKQ